MDIWENAKPGDKDLSNWVLLLEAVSAYNKAMEDESIRQEMATNEQRANRRSVDPGYHR